MGNLYFFFFHFKKNNSNQKNAQKDNEENSVRNELMERIKHEAKRLIKRKQISIGATVTTSTDIAASSPSPDTSISKLFQQGSSLTDLKKPFTVSTSTKSAPIVNHNDLPIFSMNQVNQICERMLNERESAIREQYDKILSQKMNEPYDTFVKFTHEQIQRRFADSQCSYVS